MEELEEAGWIATENKTDDEVKEIYMKDIFEEADQERRDSQDLVAIPRKVVWLVFVIQVYTKFNRNTVAKVTGIAKFAKKQNGFMNIDLETI